ncbi:MAG: TetR/AcrR family transcriptional regulator [Ilumatobacteraceae bacterium]|nr:TetR/AcrR family transcriptional regulator [Ilumatobacteraceae bacterium]
MAAKKKAPARKAPARKIAAKATSKPKRRSPVSRAEGELRLIKAAIELTRQQPFSVVGVRDIAELADINHGFVHTWFGGKTELFLAMRDYLTRSIAGRINATEGILISPTTIIDDDLVQLIKLNAWLSLEGETERLVIRDRPVITAVTKNLENALGLSHEDALRAAQLSSSLIFGGLIFGPAMGIEDNPAQLTAFWRHMLGLLAKNPRS